MKQKFLIEPIKIKFEAEPMFRHSMSLTVDYIIGTNLHLSNGQTKVGFGAEKGSITIPIAIIDSNGEVKSPEDIIDFKQDEQTKNSVLLCNELFRELRNACMQILDAKVISRIAELPDEEKNEGENSEDDKETV